LKTTVLRNQSSRLALGQRVTWVGLRRVSIGPPIIVIVLAGADP